MTRSHPAPLHPGFGNRRPTPKGHSVAWERPRRARTAAFDQPQDALLPERSLRDPSWRAGDRGDLYALAALGLSLAALAFTASTLFG